MAKIVLLTPKAMINYESIINYLISEWGSTAANNFIDRFLQISATLAENPGIFAFVNVEKKIQKCVLTKHNVIYFKETATTIRIITIFDTRQHPEKLSMII